MSKLSFDKLTTKMLIAKVATMDLDQLVELKTSIGSNFSDHQRQSITEILQSVAIRYNTLTKD